MEYGTAFFTKQKLGTGSSGVVSLKTRLLPGKATAYALNRTAFYRALKDDFAEYLAELRNPKSVDLRAHLLRKMNQYGRKPDVGALFVDAVRALSRRPIARLPPQSFRLYEQYVKRQLLRLTMFEAADIVPIFQCAESDYS